MTLNPRYIPTAKAAWTTVVILSLTYMFSMMDRQILVLLIEPIKTDLQISDTEVSLLTGFAFAIVYTFMGIPMGRAADLWIRKYVIIIGVTIWSVLTMVSGFTKTFGQLFAARMGVGFGEAALTPTAYALIPDLFPPNKLARAMSVFVLGGTAIGGGMSLLLGGVVIGQVEGLGSITLPIIGEFKTMAAGIGGCWFSQFTDGYTAGLDERTCTPYFSVQTDTQVNLPFKQVLQYLWDHKAFYGYFIWCDTGQSFGYGSAAWIPSYFIRLHEWDASSTGMTLGMLYIVPALIGGLSGGWLSDYFYNKGYAGAPLYLMLGVMLLSIPCMVLFVYLPSLTLNLIFLFLLYLLISFFFVLYPTVIQMATPNRMRAQISAIHLLVGNLAGIGFGPTVIALVTDYGFQDEMAVGHSIVIVGVLAYGIGALALLKALKPFTKEVVALNSGVQQ